MNNYSTFQHKSSPKWLLMITTWMILVLPTAWAQTDILEETDLVVDEKGFVQDNMILQRAWGNNRKTTIEWTLSAGKRCTFDVELVKRNAGVPVTVEEATVRSTRNRENDVSHYTVKATFEDLKPGGPYEIHLIVDRSKLDPETFIAENVMIGDIIIMNASPSTNQKMHPEVLALNAGQNYRIGIYSQQENQVNNVHPMGRWFSLSQNEVISHQHLSHFTTAFASFLAMQPQGKDISNTLKHVGIIPAKDLITYRNSSVVIPFDWKENSKQLKDAFVPSTHYANAYSFAKRTWNATLKNAIESYYKQSSIAKRSGELVEMQPPSMQPMPELWRDGPIDNFPITVRGVLFHENQ